MLIIRTEAEGDIKETYRWYEDQRTNLGAAFVFEIEAIFETIEETPRIYAEVFYNVRRVLCKKFSYSVDFMESKANIIVIAVLHQRRNPMIWQERTRAEQGH